MKAVIHTAFGPPEELQVREVEKPVPKDNEVLIRIINSTVTSSDCNIRNLTFAPSLFKLPARLFMFGVFAPRHSRLGVDLSGVVEAVGKDVTRFKAGDHIFGTPEPEFGTYAEYMCIPEDRPIVKKPDNISWEEAACLNLAGNTALYFMRDLGQVKAGQKVLIIGASGAIGTFAVQLAKHYGAEVTGVCGPTNVEMVRVQGADKVIDYTAEDYTKREEQYDVIFDNVGVSSPWKCRKIMAEKGLFLVNLIEFSTMLQMIFLLLFSKKKAKGGISEPGIDKQQHLADLAEKGIIKAVIDKVWPLDDIAEAFRYVEKGHKKGNVVISIGEKP